MGKKQHTSQHQKEIIFCYYFLLCTAISEDGFEIEPDDNCKPGEFLDLSRKMIMQSDNNKYA